MGLYATALSNGPPVSRDASADASLVSELQARIENQRSLINIVPGEGSVLGVWVYSGDIYAFRNKAGGATTGMYRSSSTGWLEVGLGNALNFDTTTTNGELVVGASISGATSGATATVKGVSYYGNWDTGAKGCVVVDSITGVFQDNEEIQMSTIAFDGGITEIKENDSIVGSSSGSTATVKKVTITSGAYSSDDAVGFLSIVSASGSWTDNEEIQVSGVKRALVNGASEPSTVTVAKTDGELYEQTIEPNGSYKFVNFNFVGEESLEKMYGASGVGNAFEWDGTTFIKIKTGMTTDTPENVIVFKNHLFLSYPKGSLQNSSLGLPTTWSTTLGASEIVVGDNITGMSVETKDSLAVFGRNNTFILYGTSRSDWNLTQFYTGTGAVKNTVEKIQTTIFLDDRGIVSLGSTLNYGDFKQAVISEKIDPLVQKYKNRVVTSLRVRDKNQYRLYFNDKTGIAMTFINGKNMGMLPFSLNDQIVCAVSGEDSNGDEVLYGGFDDGYIRKIDSGTSLDGQTVQSFVRLAYHHYGTPQRKKRFREILLELNADTNTTLTIQPEYNYGDGTVPTTSDYTISVTNDEWTVDDVYSDTLGVAVVDKARARINGVGETMGIIIKNESIYDKPVTLQGAVVQYSSRGLKR
jgi:hypothetical protein